MSKKVKALVERDIKNRIGDVEGIAVVSPRGLDGNKNNKLRGALRAKGLKMTVVKNTLASRATKGSKIEGFDKLLDGPSAVIYGAGVAIPNIAKLLLDAKKDNDKLEIKGIYFDGELYTGDKGIEQASKLPTREEAIAAVVAAFLSPARKIAGAIKSPASKVASILKTVEDKAKEKEGAPA